MPSPAERNLALNGLTAAMRRDFTRIWAKLNLNNPDVLRDPLAAVLAEIADKYGTAAAALAADFYDEMREQSARTAARFAPKLADLPGPERFESLAGWGISPLFGENPDPVAALHKVNGGLTDIVGGAYRETIMGSSIADPMSRGWQRVADGKACDFCLMLANRSETYSESSVEFASHDHCGCTAEPVFGGESKNVLLDDEGKRLTVSERRDRTDAVQRAKSNERVRAWIKANPNHG